MKKLLLISLFCSFLFGVDKIVYQGETIQSVGNYTDGRILKVALTDGNGSIIKSFRGAIDTHDADVHREIVNDRFHQHTETTTTLAANVSAGSTQITLTSATGFAVGDYLHIQNGVVELHHPKITVLAGTLATLDRPLDNAFSAGNSVTKTIQSMDVLGTLSSPKSFKVAPQSNEIWHLVGILIEMTHSTAGDNGLFGNLPELVNGVVLRRYDGATSSFHTFTVWKTNGTIVTDMGRVEYTARSGGGGSYGTNAYGNFKVNAGATIYLDGSLGDYLEILIQDDLTTLDRFRVKVQGHYEGA